MIEVLKNLQELVKARHENAIVDSLVSFVGFFLIMIVGILVLVFLIKVLPWIIGKSGTPIYKLFSHPEEDIEVEVYHHIDKPLKKLEF